MRGRSALLAVAVLAVGLLVASLAGAAGDKKKLKADRLSGYQENPDISTGASGSFTATLDDSAQTITYKLTYSGLEGTVTQAHVHFGKRAINGGVAFFLCGTAAAPGPAGTPTCPADGTVTRTVTAADILGPTDQGIEAMNYEELAAAMRNGSTYANVHSTLWPGGEIRAQIKNRHH
jgi:hypothetical protein